MNDDENDFVPAITILLGCLFALGVSVTACLVW